MKSYYILLIVAAGAILAACGDTPEDPVDGSFRFIHAAVSEDLVGFQLEQTPATSLEYAFGSGAQPLDSGPFDIGVNTLLATDGGTERAIDRAISVQANTDHIFVLYDDTGSLELVEYQLPEPEGNATEVRFLHAAAGAAAVDFYLEADGADLTAANALASNVAYRALSDVSAPAAGEYVLSITAAGDPTTVLLQSIVVTIADGDSLILGAFLGAETSNALLRASLFNRANSSPLVLVDTNTAPVLRVIHAGLSGGDLDVVINEDFANPLQAAVMPGEIRDYADVVAGDIKVNVTPAGNMGVLEVDQDLTLTAATRQTQIISGTAGAYASAIYADDNRGVRARAKIRFRNASDSVDLVDVYLEEPGTDLTDEAPLTFALPSAGAEVATAVLPDDYEITIILNDGDSTTEDTTVIGGPFAVTLAESTVYEFVIVDAATAGEVELLTTQF